MAVGLMIGVASWQVRDTLHLHQAQSELAIVEKKAASESLARCNFHEECEAALNEQIKYDDAQVVAVHPPPRLATITASSTTFHTCTMRCMPTLIATTWACLALPSTSRTRATRSVAMPSCS